MRVFVAGLLLAAAIAAAVALNDYRASATERRCFALVPPGETCAQATKLLIRPVGVDRSGFVLSTHRWKPRWVLPASIFLAIAGAGAALALATTAPRLART